MKKIAFVEKTANIFFLICAAVAIFAVCAITNYMFIKGTPAFKKVGVSELLFGKLWKPTAETSSYGIWYIILASIVGTGMSVLGYSIWTGSLTLILMVLPLITRNTQEALKTVPNTYRNGAIGLGSGKWHMIRTILIPSAMPGIITGTILAIGRIVGESAALLFTAGSAKLLPKGIEGLLNKPFQSGGTLTNQMYLSATSEGDFNTAFGIGVVLLIIVLGINLGTKALTRHFDVTRKD